MLTFTAVKNCFKKIVWQHWQYKAKYWKLLGSVSTSTQVKRQTAGCCFDFLLSCGKHNCKKEYKQNIKREGIENLKCGKKLCTQIAKTNESNKETTKSK